MSNKYYIATHFSQGCIFFLLRIFTFHNTYAGFYSEDSKGISLNIHNEEGNIDVPALHHFTFLKRNCGIFNIIIMENFFTNNKKWDLIDFFYFPLVSLTLFSHSGGAKWQVNIWFYGT